MTAATAAAMRRDFLASITWPFATVALGKRLMGFSTDGYISDLAAVERWSKAPTRCRQSAGPSDAPPHLIQHLAQPTAAERPNAGSWEAKLLPRFAGRRANLELNRVAPSHFAGGG